MTTAKKAAAPRKRTPKVSGAEAGTEAKAATTITSTDVRPAAEPELVQHEYVAPEANSKFQDLDAEELKDVAMFFTKDVDVADAEKGASKLELLAALASSEDGSDPVGWDDYTNIYLPAQTPKRAPVEQKGAGQVDAAERMTEDELAEVAEADDKADWVLVKMERKNPRYDLYGYTFTHAHPFHSVPPTTAEKMIRSTKGFRLALPSEVQDYYN